MKNGHNLEELGADRRLILKCTRIFFKKTEKRQAAVNAVMSLRILLIAGTTRLAADLLSSEEGLYSMELVHFSTAVYLY